MPRLELKAREPYPFSCEMVVRTTDLNYGGHLGNDRLLSLVHEARVAFLASRAGRPWMSSPASAASGSGPTPRPFTRRGGGGVTGAPGASCAPPVARAASVHILV